MSEPTRQAHDELARRISELEDAMERMQTFLVSFQQAREWPFKCPVCQGTGAVMMSSGNSTHLYPSPIDCRACKGKGIVWSKVPR